MFVAALVIAPAPAFSKTPLDEASSAPRPFQPSGMVGAFTPAILPAGVNPDKQINVIVELNEAPVGVTGGSAADLAARQEAVKSAIAGQGGTVTRQYQNAFNGFAVRIAARNAAALARLAGVSAVTPARTYQVDNAQSVPYIGAPDVWQGVAGVHGEGVKIAIIDTGIDYTHANFGGPGTPAVFTTARATSTQPADPTLFGRNATTKVKGGTDLVGDAYDADSDTPANTIPHPDPNPLDCEGHGSHVGGTAAGFGVTSAGATFSGPYDATTPNLSFRIGPGVAPRADLYAVRVFGCDGSASTEVIIAAIDWAVQNHMDVANMSLGSPFGGGSNGDPEIHAVNNATRAGLLLVISAGNEGSAAPYTVGRPSTADSALSVAAVDSKQILPGARMSLSSGRTIDALNANGAPVPGGSLSIMVLRDAGGNVSLGCTDADYPASVAGKLVVTRRGVCARVDRAVLAQKHGAAAAAMVNTDTGYPPFEGRIAGVTIPFFGVRGVLTDSTSDGSVLVDADGGTTTLAAIQINNPTFTDLADFSSSGPRFNDSFLKPEVAAPGVSIISTGIGTGNQAAGMSGTSMAAPHVTGLAALVQQSHPSWWSPEDLKQAIVNTSSPGAVGDYNTRVGGAGLVQAEEATKTVAVAFGPSDKSTLSYGFDSDFHDMHETATLLVRNHGSRPITFDLTSELHQGASHTIEFKRSTLEVPARGHASTNVTLNLPIGSVGNADEFREAGGLVKLAPRGSGNGGIALRVPYYLVPRALSRLQSTLVGQLNASHPDAQVRLTNPGGAIAGVADFYDWGLVANTPLSLQGKPYELRSAGVQSFPSGTDAVTVFAVNTRNRIANFAPYEFDILLQNQSGDLFQVFTFDFGAVTAGTFNGVVGTFIVNLQSNELVSSPFLAVAPNNGTSVLMPLLASQIGLTPSAPRFRYIAFSFDAFSDASDDLPGEAQFNAFNSAVSTGAFVSVNPGGRTLVPVSMDPAEAAITPARGIMIVTFDNNWEHGNQVELISVPMPAAVPAPAGAATARVASTPALATLAKAHPTNVKTAPDLSPRR